MRYAELPALKQRSSHSPHTYLSKKDSGFIPSPISDVSKKESSQTHLIQDWLACLPSQEREDFLSAIGSSLIQEYDTLYNELMSLQRIINELKSDKDHLSPMKADFQRSISIRKVSLLYQEIIMLSKNYQLSNRKDATTLEYVQTCDERNSRMRDSKILDDNAWTHESFPSDMNIAKDVIIQEKKRLEKELDVLHQQIYDEQDDSKIPSMTDLKNLEQTLESDLQGLQQKEKIESMSSFPKIRPPSTAPRHQTFIRRKVVSAPVMTNSHEDLKNIFLEFQELDQPIEMPKLDQSSSSSNPRIIVKKTSSASDSKSQSQLLSSQVKIHELKSPGFYTNPKKLSPRTRHYRHQTSLSLK